MVCEYGIDLWWQKQVFSVYDRLLVNSQVRVLLLIEVYIGLIVMIISQFMVMQIIVESILKWLVQNSLNIILFSVSVQIVLNRFQFYGLCRLIRVNGVQVFVISIQIVQWLNIFNWFLVIGCWMVWYRVEVVYSSNSVMLNMIVLVSCQLLLQIVVRVINIVLVVRVNIVFRLWVRVLVIFLWIEVMDVVDMVQVLFVGRGICIYLLLL